MGIGHFITIREIEIGTKKGVNWYAQQIYCNIVSQQVWFEWSWFGAFDALKVLGRNQYMTFWHSGYLDASVDTNSRKVRALYC